MGLGFKYVGSNKGEFFGIFSIFLILFSSFPGNLVQGQSRLYKIQAGDRLAISFSEYPALNSQVKVAQDGGIDLPIIGRLTAAGLTLEELRKKIIAQMLLYNKLITQLSVQVLEYGSNLVYVTGQVRTPGKYSFEEIPNLWEILINAGGPLETAFLDEVVIVRSQENGKIYVVDLTEALRTANLSGLPKIYPGDTIHVSGTTAIGTAPSPLVKRDLVYILGEVITPGAHKFEPQLNLLELIGKVGGPTQFANLKKVKHVSVSRGTVSVVEINLEKYIKSSTPVPMPVGPGDTVIIPRKSPLGGLLITTALTGMITGMVTTSIFLLLRR